MLKQNLETYWSRRSRNARCAFLFCSARFVELRALPLLAEGEFGEGLELRGGGIGAIIAPTGMGGRA